jgi:hypothetical protein
MHAVTTSIYRQPLQRTTDRAGGAAGFYATPARFSLQDQMKTGFDTLKDWGTFVIAVLGCVLGIYNAVRAHHRDKPKLRLRLKVRVGNFIADPAAYTGELIPINPVEWDAICIEIVNEGLIAVSIREVGFLLRNGDKYVANHIGSINDSKLPYDVLPQKDLILYLPEGVHVFKAKQDQLTHAYAITAAGQRFTNRMDLLRIKKLVIEGEAPRC